MTEKLFHNETIDVTHELKSAILVEDKTRDGVLLRRQCYFKLRETDQAQQNE